MFQPHSKPEADQSAITLAAAATVSVEDGGRRTLLRRLLSSTQDIANAKVVRDVIIGFADGLTVPFALTAGLSSLGSAKIVITAGLAELFSGAISMGLGAYLAAITERDAYLAAEAGVRAAGRTELQKRVGEVMRTYGLRAEVVRGVVEGIGESGWAGFITTHELHLSAPPISHAWISAATMGSSYFIGGLVPMIPYFAMASVTRALFVSIGITIVILLLFGFVKNFLTIGTARAGVWGACQTLCVGVAAAGMSYGIVRAVDSRGREALS